MDQYGGKVTEGLKRLNSNEVISAPGTKTGMSQSTSVQKHPSSSSGGKSGGAFENESVDELPAASDKESSLLDALKSEVRALRQELSRAADERRKDRQQLEEILKQKADRDELQAVRDVYDGYRTDLEERLDNSKCYLVYEIAVDVNNVLSSL